WVRTFYPGVTDEHGALKIAVRPGAELWGQDIRLGVAPVRRLRGLLLDTSGNAAPGVEIVLARAEEITPDEKHAKSADDGSFEFANVPEGDWLLTAQAERGEKLHAFATLTMAGRDLEHVELRLSAPFTITGSVTMSGTAERKRQASVLLRPAVVAPDGLRQ